MDPARPHAVLTVPTDQARDAGPPSRLAAFVRDYCRLLPATERMPPDRARSTLEDFLIRDFPAAVRDASEAGMRESEIIDALEPLRLVVSDSTLVARAQQQPRGYPGDYEMIEYILARRVTGEPGTFGRLFDEFLLHSVVAQQHHNKIGHQVALIDAALRAGGPGRPARTVLLIACGGAADLRMVDPGLLSPGDRIVLNDMDPGALAHAMATLPARTAAHATTLPGNALRKATELAAEGPYDLVMAGGLFDYLEERPARAMVRTALRHLCAPGATFYFSNIAAGNPYAVAMKYGASWPLIEREEAAVEEIVRAAGGDLVERLSIRRDATGLALLTELRRAPGSVTAPEDESETDTEPGEGEETEVPGDQDR
jgi:extracellular factor (EF) 3-hydroxypalmitic acid methyl ester biosynthesis protein